jgi:hypothetical protein
MDYNNAFCIMEYHDITDEYTGMLWAGRNPRELSRQKKRPPANAGGLFGRVS